MSPKELAALERRLVGLKDEVLAEMQGLEQRTKFVSGYSDFLTAVEQELKTLYTRVEEQGSRATERTLACSAISKNAKPWTPGYRP